MWLLARNSIAVLVFGVALFAQQPKVLHFTELAHLDADSVKLTSTGEQLTFLGTWIAPELKGMERVSAGENSYVRTVEGKKVRLYPEKMTLRITVSNRDHLETISPIALDSTLTAEELAKSLHFQLRVYQGLEYRLIDPASARIIGVPPDEPYGERIYLVEFLLQNVPIEDRLMIEVLDPQDHRVTRFTVAML